MRYDSLFNDVIKLSHIAPKLKTNYCGEKEKDKLQKEYDKLVRDVNSGFSGFTTDVTYSLRTLGYNTNGEVNDITWAEILFSNTIFRRYFISYLIDNEIDKSFIGTDKFIRLFLLALFPEGIRMYVGDISEKDKHATKSTKGQYPYIPYDVDHFMYLVNKNPDFIKGKKFIDVGCGIGDKTFMVYMLSNMKCYGLEYDYLTTHIAREKAITFNVYKKKNGTPTFICDDAIKYDFKKNNFDRVYTYIPIHDEELRIKFYKSIWKGLPKGAIWIEASPTDSWYDIVTKGGELYDGDSTRGNRSSHIVTKVK